MVFPKITELKTLTESEIEAELVKIEKDLIDLRLKKATRQQFKPHQFKYLRHKKSQLLTLLNINNR